MARIELHAKTLRGIDDVVRLCDNAVAGNVDAICVPPIFVLSAFEMLKKTKTSIVTHIGSANDTLETKIAGIDKAAMDGAAEMVITLSTHDLWDGNWERLDKEILALFNATQIHQAQLWISCGFQKLNRKQQASICDMLPDGAGLRMFDPVMKTVQLANLFDVRFICVGESEGVKGHAQMESLERVGATQFCCFEIPQLKTKTLFKTEKEL